MSRAEVDLQIAVRKACTSDEVPPKRKHVRACIVYTWDHKNSRAFWSAVKIQPVQGDQISLFKALVMIHKVIQEGHPNTLKDAYRNRDFIASLGEVFPALGSAYGRLIAQYGRFILKKLDFHRNNPGFNGMFEYEEYISLRATSDPNEGYESIMLLMDLQDAVDELQKLVFVTINQTPNNLCKISSLVPLIAEAYGIYKFCISMLRSLHKQLGDDDALQMLKDRFDQQHFMLRDFFTDCHAIKFLTSLVNIPRLNVDPPALSSSDSARATPSPAPMSAPSQALLPTSSDFEESSAPPPPPPDPLASQQTGFHLQQQQLANEQAQYELEAQRQQQLQQQLLQQQLFEQQQREQAAKFSQEQQLLQQQQTFHAQGRISELEHDLLMFKSQYDNDQQLLQQYDARVKTLETELFSFNNTATLQVAAKNDEVRNLEDQVASWSKKYETLAKLYSQLRQEHLTLLAKFKKIQQKISSAQESIVKKERLEKDLKAKTIELADLICERDRARLDVDRVRAGKDQEIEKLQAEIRELNRQTAELGKMQNLNLTTVISKHEQDMQALRAELHDREQKLAQLGSHELLQEKLAERDVELEIAHESLESAMRELSLAKHDQNDIVDAQIDAIIEENFKKFRSLIDVFLDNSIKRLHDSKHELSSPMQAGNLNATPDYVLSIVELCSDYGTDFAIMFNNMIADGMGVFADNDANKSCNEVILCSSDLTNLIHDIVLNAKGLVESGNIPKNDEEKLLLDVAQVIASTETFFTEVKQDFRLQLGGDEEEMEHVINCNMELQKSLQVLGTYIESLRAKSGIKILGDLEQLVSDEMKQTAQIVSLASEFLSKLVIDPEITGKDIEVHEALLAAARAITNAVAKLIVSATESQREIVNLNKGEGTRTEFYKKNNRWTEGLISASKSVAGATNILIQTADGVLRKRNSHEELVVASNEVAASTAQLVAASRVKANFTSLTQTGLELSSGEVSRACKALVAAVQKLMDQGEQTENNVDLSKLTPYEGKTVEMEQQVEILKLENKLNAARKRLGEIRKHGYRDDVSDDET